MLTRVCRCCGSSIRNHVENPNICALCDEMSWELEAPQLPMIYTATAADLMAGAEMGDSSNPFLSMDEPTVVECLNAEHDAHKAIAEIDALPQTPQTSSLPPVDAEVSRSEH